MPTQQQGSPKRPEVPVFESISWHCRRHYVMYYYKINIVSNIWSRALDRVCSDWIPLCFPGNYCDGWNSFDSIMTSHSSTLKTTALVSYRRTLLLISAKNVPELNIEGRLTVPTICSASTPWFLRLLSVEPTSGPGACYALLSYHAIPPSGAYSGETSEEDIAYQA